MWDVRGNSVWRGGAMPTRIDPSLTPGAVGDPARVLFFLHKGKYVRPVRLVAEALAERAEVHVVCPADLTSAFADIPRVKTHVKPESGPLRCSRIGWLLHPMFRKVILARILCPFHADYVLNLVRLLVPERMFWRRVLSQIGPHKVVVPCDRSRSFLPLLGVCARENIPAHVLSHAEPAGGDILQRRRRPDNEMVPSKRVKCFFSRFPAHFAYIENGIVITYYRLEWMVALKIMKFLPENPWALGGGTCQSLFAFSRDMRDRLVRFGCPPAKIRLTGNPEEDKIFAAYQKRVELREKYDLKYGTAGKPVVLIALPQLGEHGLFPWERHWEEIRFLAETLRQAGTGVWASLHPRMDREQYLFLEKEYGIAVCEESLSVMVPAADLFACCHSSTLHWAVQCAIPVLNFDFYGIDYRENHWMEGVVFVTDKALFSRVLQHFLRDGAYRATQGQLLAGDAVKLEPFDGKSVSRIVDILLEGH